MTARGRRALTRAAALVALVGVARALPGLLAQAVATAAAFLQMYWPLRAHEAEMAPDDEGLIWRLYVRDGRRELVTAALCLAATLPPWAALSWLVGARASITTAVDATTWARVQAAADMALVSLQEEWFWRGYVQPALGGGPKAIAVTSLAFGACHWAFAGSPLAMATAVPSVVFGELAARRGRLLAATSVHIGYNLASQLWLGG